MPCSEHEAQYKLMDIPTLKEEKVHVAWSLIYHTKQNSIFIFKCKDKNYMYGFVDYVCFAKGKKPSRSRGTKFETNSPD